MILLLQNKYAVMQTSRFLGPGSRNPDPLPAWVAHQAFARDMRQGKVRSKGFVGVQ